jgi:benzoate-CoA ligase
MTIRTERYNAADALLLPNLVGRRGERVAVIDDHGAYTYAELNDRTNRFANLLRARGLTNGQRVLLCLEDSIDFPACFLGAMRAGAIPVPLNTLMMPKDYAYIVADSEAKLVVVSKPLQGAWQPLFDPKATLVSGADSSDGLAHALRHAPSSPDTAPTRRDDVAFWLYTSGTTGNPKGVIHRHGDLEFTAKTYGREVLGIEQGDVVFSAAKLFFAYGLGNALTFPFSVGATVVLAAARPTPALVKDILRRHRPTLFCGVPTLYAMLLGDGELPPRDRLRRCISAGEALPEVILQRWRDGIGLDILDGIGTTEMLHIFISNRPDDVRPGTSGRAVPGYDVRVVAEDGRDAADDTIGDLEVRGGSSAAGYWKLPELSNATFKGGWVRTGDKYLRRPDGHLVYCGRRDDLLKVGGIYVSPMEVENALLAHPDVVEAAVVGAEDADKLIKPKAIVVARGEPSQALADALIAHVRSQLADYKRPRWIEFVDALPKTATGKIQRYKLR